MNIKVQACGFVLLVILYLLYHQQHTLQTYSRRAFLRFYAVTVLCILMDILSIVAIESASHLPALFVTFVCKTYLITLVLTALCGVMYIGVDILLSNKAFRKTEHLILLITSVVCLSIYLLPISIYCDPVTHIVYTYGSSALMTYLGAVGLILLNFALILKYRRQIRVRRRTGMLLWMLVWILSAIIQFLNPEILVVGFGSCLGVVIIYLQFENPEINLDRASGRLLFMNSFIRSIMTGLLIPPLYSSMITDFRGTTHSRQCRIWQKSCCLLTVHTFLRPQMMRS